MDIERLKEIASRDYNKLQCKKCGSVSTDIEAMQMARELLELQWIPVKERLPNPGKRVWVALSNGLVGEGS